jgi:hypothetical protein
MILLLSLLLQAAFAIEKCSQKILISAIDSPFDLHHSGIRPKLWTNPVEIPGNDIDEDKNGFLNDIHGWNSSDDNGDVGVEGLAYNINECDNECRKFLSIRYKIRSQMATQEEQDWSAATLKRRPDILDKVGNYINYLHGTSSMDVSLRNTTCTYWLGLLSAPREGLPSVKPPPYKGKRPTDDQLKAVSDELEEARTKRYTENGRYLKQSKVRIVNNSYFYGWTVFASRLKYEVRNRFDYDLDDVTAEAMGRYMFANHRRKSEAMIRDNPQILFVLVTNNNGENVDEQDYWPMHSRFPNTIVTQASHGFEKPAPFTGYGPRTTEIASPSVDIFFAVPHEMYMRGSATSLSGPVLVSAAAQLLELNPKLTPVQLKDILLRTVRKSSTFIGFNSSEGVLDVEAAKKYVIESMK